MDPTLHHKAGDLSHVMDGAGVQGRAEDDPYMGDENTYQEHFRKTFITEN